MAEKPENGIVIDFGKITRREYRDWRNGRAAAEDKDLWDAEHLYVKIITAWPFNEPISVEGYDNLSQVDSLAVDTAVSDALVALHKGE